MPPVQSRVNKAIAAAPELLEALKTIEAVIGGPPGWQAEIAKTAIAKAEGRAQG